MKISEESRRLVSLHNGDESMRAQWGALVRAALETHRNIARAARALSVNRATLRDWIKETPSLAEGIEMQERGRPKNPPAQPE